MDLSSFFNSLINILNEMSPYILLGFFIAGLLHVFVNEATLTRHLSGNGLKPVIKAAAIGIPLPLCSCGVLPTAVSLRRQGASKAATTSFLIATPQTGVDSIAATYSLLGLAFAIIRPVAALVGAVFGGFAVGRLDPDKQTSAALSSEDQPLSTDSSSVCSTRTPAKHVRFHHKMRSAFKYGFGDMIDSMGKWLVIGLIIAALITVFVPDSLFVGLRQYPLVAMIVVVLIAIPMYICATGSIPIAMSLMLKGLTPGVAFVLLMAGPAANFASILILNRTQGRKATAIYVASVVITAIAFGLIIDYLLPVEWFDLKRTPADHCGHSQLGWFETSCSILLLLLLIASAVRTLLINNHKHHHMSHENTMTLKVIGMNCAHCRASVIKAISEVEGVQDVEVNLANGTAVVTGEASSEKVAEAVRRAGFDIQD
ncbi:MAG: SO_0444 family Cu/Zn efflux transporter [Muribaculaceae bacterium]|nr:SO_0444 family Cu/Zn efflux transporter [Muribaculaceae bacterium]